LTPNAASFLILPLDFSNIEVDNFAAFEDFNLKNNKKLNSFILKYQQELEMQTLKENSDFVLNFQDVCDFASKKDLKVNC